MSTLTKHCLKFAGCVLAFLLMYVLTFKPALLVTEGKSEATLDKFLAAVFQFFFGLVPWHFAYDYHGDYPYIVTGFLWAVVLYLAIHLVHRLTKSPERTHGQ